MSGPIVDCPEHGIQQANSGIGIENSTGVTILNSRVRCPKCGLVSRVIDGTYSEHGGVLTAVLVPTPAQAMKLRAVLEWAEQEIQKPDADPEVLRTKVRRVFGREMPSLLEALDKLKSPNTMAALTWLGMMLTLGGMVFSAQGESISMDDIRQVVEQVERDASSQEPLDRHDSPRPKPEADPGMQHREGPPSSGGFRR